MLKLTPVLYLETLKCICKRISSICEMNESGFSSLGFFRPYRISAENHEIKKSATGKNEKPGRKQNITVRGLWMKVTRLVLT